MDDVFNRCVYGNICKGIKKRKHTAFSSDSFKFDEEVTKNFLNFGNLRKKDKKADIVKMRGGYKVKLSKPHLAFNLKSILSAGNPGIDLKFSEDLLEYEPDEELIVKSKVPLWVIKPAGGGNTVSIQRMW